MCPCFGGGQSPRVMVRTTSGTVLDNVIFFKLKRNCFYFFNLSANRSVINSLIVKK